MLSKSTIKFVRALSNKKQRKESGYFIAEGIKIIAEFIKEGLNIETIYYTENCKEQIITNFKTAILISEQEMAGITALQTPNSCLAVCKNFELPLVIDKNKWIIVLNDIQDPGNLGAIIRIADWCGVSSIISTSGSAELFNPKVVQATMGSLARVPYIVLNEAAIVDLAQQHNMQLVATTLDGTPLNETLPLEAGFLIIGNEGTGIGDFLLNKANIAITLPNKGGAESLNAAVATGMLLAKLVY
jgi:RNA methyltransferase, TrmH family